MSMAFDYAAIPPGYYDRVFKQHKGMQAFWHAMKFQACLKMLPPSGCVLEVGCGPGTLIGLLPGGWNGAGLDLALPQLVYAGRQNPHHRIRYFCGSATNLPYREHAFDQVVCLEFLEHLDVEQTVRCLEEMHRVLKPGGRII